VDRCTDSISILLHLAILVFLELEDEPYVVVRVARSDMEMEMENGLSGSMAVVGEDVEAVKLKAPDRCPRNLMSGVQKAVER